jgi:thiamine-phosphate pyrophosphorylase
MDANANRAREALRVMEDAARFALDDPTLAGDLKAVRHRLRDVLETLPAGWLAASRDTRGDVGRTLTEPAERSRAGLVDVAAAAGARLGESLRVLEEVAKTVSEAAGADLERLRYRGYEIDAALQRRLATGRARQWHVCVLLSEEHCVRPWAEVLDRIVAAGVDCIQVREKRMDDAALLDRVCAVIEMARPAGASVIVNDRADVALAAGADGVHLGQGDLSVEAVRRFAGRTLLVGVSTHDPDEARAAIEAGADYLGVGAMFASALKPQRRPAGTAFLRHVVRTWPQVPHLAIGGITSDNVGALVGAGARGVAVSTAVCAAAAPDAVVVQLRSALAAAQPPVPG